MIKLSKFSKPAIADNKNNGLYASLNELMAMRRYVPFARVSKNKQASSYDSGEIKSAFKGRGIEMEEVRSYQFGDDIRDIDWRVTARMNEPYTKVYALERNREIYVWLDLSPIMMFGTTTELKAVTASKIAAFLGWMALDNKDRFGCVIFDGQNSWLFPAKSGRAYIAAICKRISEIGQAALKNESISDESKLKSLKLLSQQAKKGGSVFVISSFLFWDDEYDADLACLAKNNRMFLLNIYDNLESKAPPSGQYMASFNGNNLVFDTTDKSYKKAYHNYFTSRHDEKLEWCKRFGCQLIDFTQNSSLIENLKMF